MKTSCSATMCALSLPSKRKPDDGVLEEPVVERLEDCADPLLAADGLVHRLHAKRTSTVASFTMRAIVAKSSSPRPLSSSQRPQASSHEKCQARALAASQIWRVGRCVLTTHRCPRAAEGHDVAGGLAVDDVGVDVVERVADRSEGGVGQLW